MGLLFLLYRRVGRLQQAQAASIRRHGKTVSTSSFSPPNSAFTNDPNCISDEYLDSRTYAVAAAASQLVFRNSYDLEASDGIYFDGMVLEISINGGPFTDIITAGGSFATGGYNGTISSGLQ
jgi:hypothetical protein